MIDIYNVLNAATILAVNNTYGPAWPHPATAFMAWFFDRPMRVLPACKFKRMWDCAVARPRPFDTTSR